MAELLSLLEDEPFRVVMHQGLDSDSEYSKVTKCLKAQYNPDGNELECQAKFQQWMQNQMNGSLNMLEQFARWLIRHIRLESNVRRCMVSDQFIRGVCSPSIQLKLMQDKPSSLEEA